MTPKPYDGSERLDLDAIYETRPQAAGWRADIEYLIKRVRWLEAQHNARAPRVDALRPAASTDPTPYDALDERTRGRLHYHRAVALVSELGPLGALEVMDHVALRLCEIADGDREGQTSDAHSDITAATRTMRNVWTALLRRTSPKGGRR